MQAPIKAEKQLKPREIYLPIKNILAAVTSMDEKL